MFRLKIIVLKEWKSITPLNLFTLTLISLTKNLVYKNIEAQMRKKIKTIIRTLPTSKPGFKKYLNLIC